MKRQIRMSMVSFLCPLQLQGIDNEQRIYYLRHRHQHWQICISKPGETYHDAICNPTEFFEGYDNDENCSFEGLVKLLKKHIDCTVVVDESVQFDFYEGNTNEE